MKVIALLILSMAVVVCEQQTLFAPHYVGFELRAPVPTGRRNSLRPAARVNRLAPVNSSYAAAAPPRNDVWVVDTGNGLTGSRYEEIASSQKNDWTIIGNPSIEAKDLNIVDPTDCSDIVDPADYPNIVDPGLDSLHNNGAFLPWHREYIYR